jgi:hypothetical protein
MVVPRRYLHPVASSLLENPWGHPLSYRPAKAGLAKLISPPTVNVSVCPQPEGVTVTRRYLRNDRTKNGLMAG